MPFRLFLHLVCREYSQRLRLRLVSVKLRQVAVDADRRGAGAAFSAPPPGGGGRSAQGGRGAVTRASLDHMAVFADAFGRRVDARLATG